MRRERQAEGWRTGSTASLRKGWLKNRVELQEKEFILYQTAIYNIGNSFFGWRRSENEHGWMDGVVRGELDGESKMK